MPDGTRGSTEPGDTGLAESTDVSTANWTALKRNLRTKLAPAAFSGSCVGLGAVVLGASPATGLLLGLADAALRPVARNLLRDYRRFRARRARIGAEESLSDGGGI